jgi:uncharacterized membrane protein
MGTAMSYARQLLNAYPGTLTAGTGALAGTIDALSDCSQACIADADGDLREQNLPEMVTCIRLCLDCADVCAATLGVVTRQTARDATVTRLLLEACAAVCKSCGDECERHAEHHEHCRICAQACRRCEQACRDLLRTLRSGRCRPGDRARPVLGHGS